MKTLTWNVNRAGDSRLAAWEMLQREDADIVLLQEVGRIPDWILRHYRYNCYWRCCMNPIVGMVLACYFFVSCFFLLGMTGVCPDGSFD